MRNRFLFPGRTVFSLVLPVAALACLYAHWVSAADIARYSVLKGQVFDQTSMASPTSPSTNGFLFLSSVESTVSGSVLNASLSLPNGSNRVLSAENPTTFSTQDLFNSRTVLDAAYPTGTYTFVVDTLNEGTNMPSLTIATNSYPSTPRVTNWAAAQLLDASKDFQVSWSGFNGGTSNDLIQLIVQDNLSNDVFNSGSLGDANALNGTNHSITLPAGTLETGQVYQAQLTFLKVASLDTDSLPGATGLAAFFSETGFTISTHTNSTGLGIVTSALSNGEIGVSYGATLVITGGLPPYIVSTEKGFLPPALSGLAFSLPGTNAMLSGRPNRPWNPSHKTPDSKKSKFTLLVIDQTGASATKKLKLRIFEPITIDTKTLPDAVISNSYRASLKAVRGEKPYTWTNIVELPSGLNLDSVTGQIAGIPTTNGVFSNLVFKVSDPLGGSNLKLLSLTIAEPHRAK
jgi:hypothetical protein